MKTSRREEGHERQHRLSARPLCVANQVNGPSGAALYPGCPMQAFKVDEFVDAFEDVRAKLVRGLNPRNTPSACHGLRHPPLAPRPIPPFLCAMVSPRPRNCAF